MLVLLLKMIPSLLPHRNTGLNMMTTLKPATHFCQCRLWMLTFHRSLGLG
jgi:hypothetical protein